MMPAFNPFARCWLALLTALLLAGAARPAAAQFDHQYSAWNSLLGQHVRWLPENRGASQVDYAGFRRDRASLQQVLASLSAVTPAQFSGWSGPQQKAFLINAYNAFTVELILSGPTSLRSIKDLGSLLQSPWKKPFFRLLGEQRHLDWIEHERLRPEHRDWRIHFAVNCASIGCPALRDEAYVAGRLDAQLDDQTRRFLADRTRNRVRDGRLEVSSIFKWYREDFERGDLGLKRLQDLFAQHAELLVDDPALRAQVKSGALPIDFLAYDWLLNDRQR
jgi:hypothetical protein